MAWAVTITPQTVDGVPVGAPVLVTVSNVGLPGPPGPGLPPGGTAGQVPVKASGDDYDTEWSRTITSEDGRFIATVSDSQASVACIDGDVVTTAIADALGAELYATDGTNEASIRANADGKAEMFSSKGVYEAGGDDLATVPAVAAAVAGKLDTPGAWAAWTPTISGLSLGDGTVDAHYCQVGKLVVCRIVVTIGSTTTMGDLSFTPPVAAKVAFSYGPVGVATVLDVGTRFYFGNVYQIGASDFRIGIFTTFGSYQTITGLTASVPFTWVSGDRVSATFTYEAA